MQMTRSKISGEVRMRLGEALGTTGGGDPITLDTDITNVCEEMCYDTDAFYYGGTAGPGAWGTEIVANQVDYNDVPVYKIGAVTIQDEQGMRRPCTVKTEREMDREVGPWWRMVSKGQTSVVTAAPWYIVLKGKGKFQVWPVPNYTSVVFTYTDLVIGSDGTLTSVARPFTSSDVGSSLNITGGTNFTTQRFTVLFVDATGHAQMSGTVGVAGATGGIAVFGTGGIQISGYGMPPAWPLDSDVCPIPSEDHMTVVWGVCIQRCTRAKASRDETTRAIAIGLMPDFQRRYTHAMGNLEASAATTSQHSGPGLRIWG